MQRRNTEYDPVLLSTNPIASEQQQHERSRRFRDNKILRFMIGSWNLIGRMLAWCFPKTFGAKDVEGATPSRAATWVGRMTATTIHEWKKIVGYLAVIAITLLFIFFSGAMSFVRSDQFSRTRQAESLMKHCKNHEDRLTILNEAAHLVPVSSLNSGFLPCGSSLEIMKDKLIKLHTANPTRICFTAKHLNHSYAIISVREKNSQISFMFNLIADKFAQLGVETEEYEETSDFFPLLEPIKVKRPKAAWISWRDSVDWERRDLFRGDKLAAILQAWEILDGEHYNRFKMNALAKAE